MIDPAKLRDAMRAKGIQGQELARRAGCSRITISRIRNGHQGTSRGLAERIAAALDMDPGELQPAPEGVAPDGFATGFGQEARDVLDEMSRMSPADRRVVWAFVKGLVASGSSEAAAAAGELEAAARQVERAAEEREDTQAAGA